MSDLNNPNNFDKYGNPVPPNTRFEYEPADRTGRAPYILLGLLVLIGIVGGAMYFNGGPRKGADVATAPAATSDNASTTNPMRAPPRALPGGTTTPTPATPAPAPSDAPVKQ